MDNSLVKMLEKLTGKDELKESLMELKSDMEDMHREHREQFNLLKKDLDNVNKSISSLEQSKDSIFSTMKSDMEEIGRAKDEILKSAKVLQETQSVLYSQVYGKLNDALKLHVNSLKSTNDEFESLRPEVQNTVLMLNSIKDEIQKLHELSKTIKQQDVQLTEYIKDVQKLDDEKLRLMRQVDKLQDIIAKERRGPVRRLTY